MIVILSALFFSSYGFAQKAPQTLPLYPSQVTQYNPDQPANPPYPPISDYVGYQLARINLYSNIQQLTTLDTRHFMNFVTGAISMAGNVANTAGLKGNVDKRYQTLDYFSLENQESLLADETKKKKKKHHAIYFVPKTYEIGSDDDIPDAGDKIKTYTLAADPDDWEKVLSDQIQKMKNERDALNLSFMLSHIQQFAENKMLALQAGQGPDGEHYFSKEQLEGFLNNTSIMVNNFTYTNLSIWAFDSEEDLKFVDEFEFEEDGKLYVLYRDQHFQSKDNTDQQWIMAEIDCDKNTVNFTALKIFSEIEQISPTPNLFSQIQKTPHLYNGMSYLGYNDFSANNQFDMPWIHGYLPTGLDVIKMNYEKKDMDGNFYGVDIIANQNGGTITGKFNSKANSVQNDVSVGTDFSGKIFTNFTTRFKKVGLIYGITSTLRNANQNLSWQKEFPSPRGPMRFYIQEDFGWNYSRYSNLIAPNISFAFGGLFPTGQNIGVTANYRTGIQDPYALAIPYVNTASVNPVIVEFNFISIISTLKKEEKPQDF